MVAELKQQHIATIAVFLAFRLLDVVHEKIKIYFQDKEKTWFLSCIWHKLKSKMMFNTSVSYWLQQTPVGGDRIGYEGLRLFFSIYWSKRKGG